MRTREERKEAMAIARGRNMKPWSLAVLGFFAILGVCALIWLWNHRTGKLFADLLMYHQQIHAFASDHVLVAPAAFILAYAGLMLLIWIPSWPCTVLGGFLFGATLGIPCSLAGSTLGALGVFALGRSAWGRRLSVRNPLLQKIRHGLSRDAFAYVAALRLMPVMPFGIVHVAAAYFEVPLPAFTLGTMVGMVPCIVIYSLLGADIDLLASRGAVFNMAALMHPNVLVPLSGLAALAVVPAVLRQVRAKRAIPAQPVDFR
jgi:uncharacterized membrane protein YdjX (TVP38/TMEM64 family)